MASQAVLITGAGTRLGSFFARHLAKQGYDIALHYNRSATGATQLANELQKTGVKCQLFKQDFSEDFDSDAFILKVLSQFPKLSCLINNASAYEAGESKHTSRSMVDSQFKVNFITPFLLSGSFTNVVGNGQIINILDNKIAYNQFQYSAYLLSKKTLADYTKMAALEFAPHIRVNGIAPGVTLPGETRDDEYVKWRLQGIPLARQGELENLYWALDYVMNNEFVTGQILFVDGGEAISHVGRNFEEYKGSE